MKRLKKTLCMILAAALIAGAAVFIGPAEKASAAGTQYSDSAGTVFFYATDTSGSEVLLKAISLDTLKGMMHGEDSTASSYYPASFIDSFPTPTYCEGKGITVSELLDYVTDNSSVTGASALTYAGSDRLFFVCCDGASANYTYTSLLGTDRYYFPELYNNWDCDYKEVSNPAAVLASGVKYEPYLAVVSEGGRVFAEDAGSNGTIADYITANSGQVTGCLTGVLSDDYALRLIFFQTASDIENSTPTYGNVKKWVYKMMLKESGTSPVTSLGTVPDPEVTYTLCGTTLTVTMRCGDPQASIYYSNVNGSTTTPLNLYTGPVTIEDYDTNDPFTLGVQAVREGYVSSEKVLNASSDITEPEEAPTFTFALAGDTEGAKVGTQLSFAASLTSDKNYSLYGAEYQISIPSADFSVGSVTAADGWQAQSAVSGENNVITFLYLDTVGVGMDTGLPVNLGTFTVTPLLAGEKTFTVTDATVTKEDAAPYGSGNITAQNLSFTVAAGSTAIKGDINGNGRVNGIDLTLLRQHLAGTNTLTGTQLDAADVNGSGGVNGIDLTLMRQYLAGIISSFG